MEGDAGLKRPALIGSDATRNRRDSGGFFCDFVVGDIADEFVAFLRAGGLDAIDADINDDGAFFDMLSGDEMRPANRGDDDVSLPSDRGQITSA